MNDQNYLLNKTYQFRTRFVLYDGRKSAFSPISQLKYVGGGDCNKNGSNLPRCFDIRLYAGSWMVEKIEIYFRNCNGSSDLTDLNVTEWYLYDTVYKYDKTNAANVGVNFWERVITLPNYVAPTDDCMFDNGLANTFVYRFCGDKQCTPIARADTSRIYDDLPISSDALTSVGDQLVSGGNVKLYDNLGNDILSRFQFSVDLPSASTVCPTGFAKVSGYVVIHNPYIDWNQPIHKDDDVGKIAFGGIGKYNGINAPYVSGVATSYNQNFGSDENAAGFIIGFRSVNGNFYTRTTQRRIDLAGNILETGVENSTGDGNRGRIARNIGINNFYAQYFEMNVPKGWGILELYGHGASILDSNFKNTSTYVAGYQQIYLATGGGTNLVYGADEIVINTCNGDVDVRTQFGYIIVSDLTRPEEFTAPEASVWYGYLKEKSSATPIELADFRVYANPSLDLYEPPAGTTDAWRAKRTDRNGFYWFSVSKGLFASTGSAEFYGFQECDTFRITSFTVPADPPNGSSQLDVQQTEEKVGASGSFNDCANVIVEGYIKDCDGNGLPNVDVVMNHMRATVTDANGYYAFKLHAEVDFDNPTRGSRVSNLIFVTQNGTCFLVGCDNCDTCISHGTDDFNDCDIHFRCVDGEVYTYTASDKILKYANANLKGLHSGTRYQFSAIFGDFMGRTLFAQTADNFFIDTPFITDTGGIFAPSIISWKLTALLDLLDEHPHIKYISFARTTKKENNVLQWALSKVTFVDPKGTPTSSVGATYIQIELAGLTNYNTLNPRSNVKYVPADGDRIKFIDNGSGTADGLYTSLDNGGVIDLQLRSLTKEDGTTIMIVDYDTRLVDLKLGAWVEIYSATVCDTQQIFYEFCQTYAVINGNIVDSDGTTIPINTPQTIGTWDTYYLYRAIPQKNATGTDAVFTTYHPYEHVAPSDFWGYGCQDIGRVFIESKDAKQTKRKDEISWSDNFVNNGIINGFGTWRSENIKNYTGQDYGGIKAIHAERGIGLVICENDFFLIGINEKYTVTGTDGLLRSNAGEFLSDAKNKTGSRYGCSIQGAIKFFDGGAAWYDDKMSALVVCNYSSAFNAALGREENAPVVSSYLMEKTRAFKVFNANNGNGSLYKFFVNMGYDPKYKQIHLTWFSRYSPSHAQTDPFINNERKITLTRGETITYDLRNDIFTTFPAFTPEYFSQSETGQEQKLLIAFKNGFPYVHNRTDLTENIYNTFFGTATDSIIEPVFNIEPSKLKMPMSIDVQSNVKWFVDRILTSEADAISQIPPIRWKGQAGVWHAEILRNESSIGGLYKGRPLTGFFARIRFVRDNSTQNNVNNIDSNKQKEYFELDQILIKFAYAEKSGR